MTLQNHQVIMRDYALSLTEETREQCESEGVGDWLEDVLEIAFWRRCDSLGSDDAYRCELLLCCGGPTARVIIDEYDHVTVHHSWGALPDGTDCHEFQLWGDGEKSVWLEIAEYCAELFPGDIGSRY